MSNFNDSELIAGYVSKLNPEDLKKLSKFIDSPYHNSQKILIPFFEIIQQYYPNFEHKNFTKEKIYKKLYPDRKYADKTFQGLMKNLKKLIEAYYAHEELKRDAFLNQKLIRRGFSARNDYSKFRNSSEKTIQEIEASKNKSLMDFKNLLDVTHELFIHPETPRDNKWTAHYINACMDTLDCFYFFSKIRYGVEILTRNRLQDKQYEIKLLGEAVQLGRETELKGNTLFVLYTLLIAFLKSQNKRTYSRLKSHLIQHHDKIPKEGEFFTSTILVNYCSTQYSKGKHIYLEESVQLHKFRDNQDLFLMNDQISNYSFINVIVTVANCRDFEWTTYFKNKYAKYIQPDLREDALCLSKAYIHFYKGEYLDTIAELKDIESKDPHINLRFRSLSIRAYYGLSSDEDYKETTEKSIQRFITYLKSKNLVIISEVRKMAYKNFCMICLDLLYGKKKKALNKLKKTRNVMFRNWLLNKANELKEL